MIEAVKLVTILCPVRLGIFEEGKMKTREFQSYSGDTYESWTDERERVRYRRIKKAAAPEWAPAPRIVTSAEIIADLRAELSRLTLSAAESQREEWRDGAADFACHLSNNCELETITEEFIRQALVDFAKAAEAVRHE